MEARVTNVRDEQNAIHFIVSDRRLLSVAHGNADFEIVLRLSSDEVAQHGVRSTQDDSEDCRINARKRVDAPYRAENRRTERLRNSGLRSLPHRALEQ